MATKTKPILIKDETLYRPPSEKAYNKAIATALKRVQAELIDTPEDNWNYARMAEIMKILKKELKKPTEKFLIDFFKDLYSTIWVDTKALETTVKGAIKKPIFVLDKKSVKYILSFQRINFRYLNSKGEYKPFTISVDDLLKNPSRDTIKQVKAIINTGAITGVNPNKISNEVIKQIGELTKREKSNVRTAVRTMFAEASNRVHLNHLRKNQDIYDYFQFVAHKDERTSKICNSLNLKIYDEFEDIPNYETPPLHPNCRSVIIGKIIL